MSAAKKLKNKLPQSSRQPVPQPKQINVQPMLKTGDNRQRELIYILVCVFATLLVYLPSLTNGFIVNWDDGGYIHEHELVHSITWHNFITIFNPSTFYKGNYHPLTTFLYAIQYSFAGLNPFLYHLVNLIFHLANVYLVFYFIRLISKRPEVAAFVALMFGIHPMHVESVAWISELKDVMYTFFFLLSLIQYYNYATKKQSNTRFFLLAILFFFLSLLSKSAAVSLPGVLILLDYYMKRKFNWKLLADKIPFIFLSFAFGYIAILSQSEKGAIQDLTPMFTIFERVLIVCHSTMTYIWKLFVPIQLGAMYPYPSRVNGHFPVIYFIALFIVALLTMLVAYLFISSLILRKKERNYAFGALFFFINIALVLQMLPVGGAAMAERYTYVPYIGFFFIFGVLYDKGLKNKAKIMQMLKPLLHIVVAAFVIFFSFLTWQRIEKWKNGEVLMRDLTKVYPYLPFAYNNLGYYYHRWEKNYDKALVEYNTALKMDPTYYQAWSNRGVVYNNTGKHELAIKDFTECLKYKPDNIDALLGRANSLSAINKFQEALPDYDKYLKIKSDDAKGWMWRGMAYAKLKKPEQAFPDLEQSRKLDPKNYEVYYWEGLLYYEKNDYKTALDDLDKSISLETTKPDIYSWRGLVRYKMNMLDSSIDDFNKALSMNPKDGAALVNRSVSYNQKGNYQQAWEDINSAGKLGYPLDKNYFMTLKAKAGK
jgi:protein O-mannosyl-transferase